MRLCESGPQPWQVTEIQMIIRGRFLMRKVEYQAPLTD